MLVRHSCRTSNPALSVKCILFQWNPSRKALNAAWLAFEVDGVTCCLQYRAVCKSSGASLAEIRGAAQHLVTYSAITLHGCPWEGRSPYKVCKQGTQ